MFIINISNPIFLFIIILFVGIFIVVGHHTKKSLIIAIPLFVFILLLIMHIAQVVTLSAEYADLANTLYRCITFDFLFILITFSSYLWIDSIEAKASNVKSIDNSLEWFWKEI